jgi:hypothetical protein
MTEQLLDNDRNEYVDTATEDAYAELSDILDEAFDFAAYGKGAQRHGQNGLPWKDQPHFQIAKDMGQAFALGQVIKKIREGHHMDDWAAARREFLGAISYIASAIYAGDQGID